MPTKLTPARQRNAVSEGTALGLLVNGYNSVRFDKWRVDLAFASAWRSWSYASRFPQVSTDLRKGLDGWIALTRAGETKRTLAFFWDHEGGELVIYARQPDWDPQDSSDVDFAIDVIGGEIPREGWSDLAATFVTKMDR